MATDRLLHHPILDIPADPAMVEFTFDGEVLTARRSEVISSALFANGVHVFGRHKKDGAPQGIFCANGQCAQCLVVADGRAVKACITPVRPGMRVRSVTGVPALDPDDRPIRASPRIQEVETDILIVGGGPAGLAAAAELGAHGIRVIVCDDKPELGGKLALQTHNFFGSVQDCYAGHRGTEIGHLLEEQVRAQPSVELWTDAPVVGVFQDGFVGVVRHGAFVVVRPKALLVAAGARERALAFPGADLPGVYGGGAFQTLVNRDLIQPSRRLLIVGGGNVGLIVAYQALQAGIDVVAVLEILPQVGGYKVHRDKILRLGVPVHTSTTLLRAEGDGRVERAVAARVDDRLNAIPGTEVVFDVDTVLVAVGLSSVRELFDEGRRLGLKVYAAGDAREIAEASAAIFSGKIAARTILRDLGVPVDVPEAWTTLGTMLASHPGPVRGTYPTPPGMTVYPIIRCAQEIPCNPCTTVCPKDSIRIPEGNILGRPKLDGECVGCLKCVAVCPGLAITMVDLRVDPTGRRAKVTVPWEMPEELVKPGDSVPTTGMEGEAVGTGTVVRILSGKALNKRRMMVLDVPASEADRVAGVRIRAPEPPARAESRGMPGDRETVLCRCERVTKEAVEDYIRATGTRDVNAVKAALRSGMGPCGGKTCGELILRVFRELGIEATAVTPPVHRPFTQEVPITAFLSVADGDGGV
jgi:NADPH-dependent 2,4-dienoyl-CoA reductase/sulfur reductase-like enzyme/Pyruvate/2-oxoacid:ferredoxin oxidoreductase delta subunit